MRRIFIFIVLFGAFAVAQSNDELAKFHSVWMGDQQEIDHSAREAIANTHDLTDIQRATILARASTMKTMRCVEIKKMAKDAVTAAVKLGNKTLAKANYSCDDLGK